MKKFAVVALCALALVSPAAEPLRSIAVPAAAAAASLENPGGAPELPPAGTAPDTTAPPPLPPSQAETGLPDPQPGPVTAGLSPDTPGPAAGASPSASLGSSIPAPQTAPSPAFTPPSTPPQPASIPPLSATDAELAAAAARNIEAAPEVSAQALVRDNNSSQLVAVFDAINRYRSSLGLPPVKYHDTVAAMSQEWSDSIASREVIEHRANFWGDARALNPTNGAGEVIAVRWDRDAAQLVEWWKGSPAHDAILRDPRFNVIGIGITFTDGDWRTTPNRYTMWGVVNFFGYSVLPAGTTTGPGGGTGVPAPSPSVCDPAVKHMPPTLDLTAAAIKSGSDLLSVDSAGALVNRPWLGGRNFGAPEVIGGGFSSALQIFLTDWERDGVYDVLAQWSDGRVTLHSGLAGGGFRGSVTLGQSGWAGMTVALGQWCSNNRLPQLLALDGSGNLWLYHNTGLGDLSQRTMVGTGIPATRLSMVDYDADGFQDLLALQSNGNVLLYRGAGVPSPRTESRKVVASGWSDVTAIRPLRNVTGINSTGLALRRGGDVVQYWDLSGGALSSPSNISGAWAGIRLAQ